MEDAKIFIRFLRLAQNNFRNKRDIDFYAAQLNVTPDELERIIAETSESDLPEWLDVMEMMEESCQMVY